MPLIVMVLLAQAAVTPVGKPVAVPIPVAPVVVWVMEVKGELIQRVGVEEAAPAVLLEFIVTVVAELVAVQPTLVAVTV